MFNAQGCVYHKVQHTWVSMSKPGLECLLRGVGLFIRCLARLVLTICGSYDSACRVPIKGSSV